MQKKKFFFYYLILDEEESSGEEPDVKEKAKEIGEKEQECFRTYQNRSLVGFADEVKNDLNHRQCLYACYSCNDCLDGDPCNSVTYYRLLILLKTFFELFKHLKNFICIRINTV